MSIFKSAVILAGGLSTRMGFDKQFLTINEQRLAEHLITVLTTRFDDLMVASPNPELYDPAKVRVIADIHAGIGPLGGIHSALVNAQSNAVFVIACDMPFVEIPYIDYMISRMANQSYQACLTSKDQYLETFHAFYHRSSLTVLERELSQGRYSVNHWVRKINSLIIPEQIAASYLPGWLAFTNINTPGDYAMFLQMTNCSKGWED